MGVVAQFDTTQGRTDVLDVDKGRGWKGMVDCGTAIGRLQESVGRDNLFVGRGWETNELGTELSNR